MGHLSDYETDNSLKENFETEIKSGPQDRNTVTSQSLNETLKVLPALRFFFSVSTFDPWMCKFSMTKLDLVVFSINALHRSLSQLQCAQWLPPLVDAEGYWGKGYWFGQKTHCCKLLAGQRAVLQHATQSLLHQYYMSSRHAPSLKCLFPSWLNIYNKKWSE